MSQRILGEFSLNSTPTPASDLEAERLTRNGGLGYRIMASWGWGADGSGHITARDLSSTLIVGYCLRHPLRPGNCQQLGPR